MLAMHQDLRCVYTGARRRRSIVSYVLAICKCHVRRVQSCSRPKWAPFKPMCRTCFQAADGVACDYCPSLLCGRPHVDVTVQGSGMLAIDQDLCSVYSGARTRVASVPDMLASGGSHVHCMWIDSGAA